MLQVSGWDYAFSDRLAALRTYWGDVTLSMRIGACPPADVADVNERHIIPAALAAGIGIVNYGNTRRVEEPRLSQRAGGLSGPEIFEATLANLERTRRVFGDRLEIIATGGVDAPDKALRLLDAGATAVGYFTGFITRGPILARQMLEALVARL